MARFTLPLPIQSPPSTKFCTFGLVSMHLLATYYRETSAFCISPSPTLVTRCTLNIECNAGQDTRQYEYTSSSAMHSNNKNTRKKWTRRKDPHLDNQEEHMLLLLFIPRGEESTTHNISRAEGGVYQRRGATLTMNKRRKQRIIRKTTTYTTSLSFAKLTDPIIPHGEGGR